MEKVIISATINDFVDSEFLNNLIIFLREEGYHSEVFTDNTKSKFPIGGDFDLLIVLNELTMDIPCDLDICVVYFMNRGDIKNINYLINSDHDFLFEYGGRLGITVDPSFVSLNILYQDETSIARRDFEFDSFFIFQSPEAFYQLLWLFNSRHDKRIAVFCKGDVSVFNDNVTVVSEDDFDEVLSLTCNVVGEGPLLLKALLAGKPILVAGKFGLGGVVNAENLSGLLAEDFRGRLGGTENELIPKNLLLYEYNSLQYSDLNAIAEMKDQTLRELRAQRLLLKKVLNRLTKYRRGFSDELFFISNRKYGYFSIPDSSDYIVYNTFSKQLLYTITKEQYRLISFFDCPKTLEDAAESIPEISRDKIVGMAKELIKAKSLKYALLN